MSKIKISSNQAYTIGILLLGIFALILWLIFGQKELPLKFTNATTYQGHTTIVEALAYSPDGQSLISGDANGTVRIWNENKQINDTGNPLFNRLQWLPGGQTFVTADLRVWDRTGQPKGSLPAGFQTYLPDGQTMALIDPTQPQQLLLRQANGKILNGPSVPNEVINQVAFSADGRTLAIASSEKKGLIPGATSQLGYGSDNIRVRLFRLGQPDTDLLDFKGYNRPVTTMSFSPDGNLLAVSTKGTAAQGEYARIWNHDGGLVAQLEGDYAIIGNLQWSPDGQLLAGICSDYWVRFWNRNGKLQSQFSTPNDPSPNGSSDALAWSPDGVNLAVGIANNTIKIWQVGHGYITGG